MAAVRLDHAVTVLYSFPGDRACEATIIERPALDIDTNCKGCITRIEY